MSRLVVMGSGETAPTLVPVHRDILASTPPGPAVMLDTPFAFQMNRAELVVRTVGYFAQSVGREVEVVAWPPLDDDAGAEDRALSLLERATWAFAGPGSPTYALSMWRDTAVPAALAALVRRGGTLVLGSAAAVTLGDHALPVYEIYKVGEEPRWEPGLDLAGDLLDVSAAVLPHYDNREGGSHDTRYCYLGEPRLAALEQLLPERTAVVGVDEHTAVVLDLVADDVRVVGRGALSVRRQGRTTRITEGEGLTLAGLRALVRGEAPTVEAAGEPAAPPAPAAAAEPPTEDSLHALTERVRSEFGSALAARDVRRCVAALLELEAGIAAWSADTLQSSDLDDARRVLRALVVQLGEVAETGARDPREVLGPVVDVALDVRRAAREGRDFAMADLVRDRLAAVGIEVRDTAEGTDWVVEQ